MKIYTEKELTKAYYAISELAEMFQVNASLIRFWHKEFDKLIKPKINAKGNRLFTPKDVVNFSKIYYLVKIQGYTLEGAKKAMKSKEPLFVEEENLPENTMISNNSRLKEELIQRLEQLKAKIIKS